MNHLRQHKGYILPTVLVFSLVTMALGVTFLQYATSFSSILRNDHYANLAKQAADSGVLIAQKCVEQGSLSIDTWANDSVMRPNTNCRFEVSPDASEFVSETPVGNSTAVLRTTYSVDKPTTDENRLLTFTATGTTQLFPSSTSTHAAFTETAFSKIQVPYSDGPINVPAAEDNAVTDIDSGLGHTCAVVNMEPYCWGIHNFRQTGSAQAPGISAIEPSPVRLSHQDGANQNRRPGQSQIPEGQTVHSVGTGPNHSCTLGTNGRMYCWGYNLGFGPVGAGARDGHDIPLRINEGAVGGDRIVTSMVGGEPSSIILSNIANLDTQQYGCALADGRISCAGQNFFGQLGQVHHGRELYTITNRPSNLDWCWPHAGGFLTPKRCGTIMEIFPLPLPFGFGLNVHPSMDFTPWAFGAGIFDFISGSDRDRYTDVFGYDKSRPDRNRYDRSRVGKFNASDVSAAQFEACALENGRVHCWGDSAAMFIYSMNGWGCAGSNLPPAGDFFDSLRFICPSLGEGVINTNRGNVISSHGSRSGDSLAGKRVDNITATFGSTCAIAEGRAHCWGRDLGLRDYIPSDLQESNLLDLNFLIEVAQKGLGLLPVDSWRTDPVQRPASHTGGRSVTGVHKSGGDSLACFTASGEAWCWGRLRYDETNPFMPSHTIEYIGGTPRNMNDRFPEFVEKISSSRSTTCALMNASVYCYGANDRGQAGVGTSENTQDAPAKAAFDKQGNPVGIKDGTIAATDISSGENHSCAIANGVVHCWGSNANGQLGSGDRNVREYPHEIERVDGMPPRSATHVSAGAQHTCAIVDGDVWCWGDNTYGQLGNNSNTSSNTPVKAHHSWGKATHVSAGAQHTCAVINGHAACWGNGANGRLGDGTTNRRTPHQINFGTPHRAVSKVAAGNNFSCAIGAERAWCWGANTNGQVGNGSTTGNAVAPVEVNLPGKNNGHNGLGNAVTEITAGNDFACAIMNGEPWCWGANNVGQLGSGGGGSQGTPRKVANAGVTSEGPRNASFNISAGADHACAIIHGSSYCWGALGNGRLGNGGASGSANTPQLVHKDASNPALLGVNNAYKLAAGGSHTCAIANGKLTCWGRGDSGQLAILGRSGVNNTTPQAAHPFYAQYGNSIDWSRAVRF